MWWTSQQIHTQRYLSLDLHLLSSHLCCSAPHLFSKVTLRPPMHKETTKLAWSNLLVINISTLCIFQAVIWVFAWVYLQATVQLNISHARVAFQHNHSCRMFLRSYLPSTSTKGPKNNNNKYVYFINIERLLFFHVHVQQKALINSQLSVHLQN